MIEPNAAAHEILLSETTSLRLTPVVGAADGIPLAVDFRLFRRTAGGVAFGPTSAGLRIPLHALRRLAEVFAALERTYPAGGK